MGLELSRPTQHGTRVQSGSGARDVVHAEPLFNELAIIADNTFFTLVVCVQPEVPKHKGILVWFHLEVFLHEGEAQQVLGGKSPRC